jgi:hypothetical protein
MGCRERNRPVSPGFHVIVGLDNGWVMAVAKSEAAGRIAASPAALDARSTGRVRGVACEQLSAKLLVRRSRAWSSGRTTFQVQPSTSIAVVISLRVNWRIRRWRKHTRSVDRCSYSEGRSYQAHHISAVGMKMEIIGFCFRNEPGAHCSYNSPCRVMTNAKTRKTEPTSGGESESFASLGRDAEFSTLFDSALGLNSGIFALFSLADFSVIRHQSR